MKYSTTRQRKMKTSGSGPGGSGGAIAGHVKNLMFDDLWFDVIEWKISYSYGISLAPTAQSSYSSAM